MLHREDGLSSSLETAICSRAGNGRWYDGQTAHMRGRCHVEYLLLALPIPEEHMSFQELIQNIGNFPHLAQFKYINHRRIDDS